MSTIAPSSTESTPPSAPPAAGELARGSLGVGHIIFLVLAAAAPMAVVVAIMPIAIAFGNGAGTPGMFLLAALVLLLFSVGYVRAVPYVRNAGAFYAYIAQGLGRPAGLVAAYLAMVGYNSLSAATCGALAFFAFCYQLARFNDDHSRLRDALWYCDMTTSPDGHPTTAENRLAEIRRRRGPDDPVVQALEINESERLKAVRRIHGLLRRLAA